VKRGSPQIAHQVRNDQVVGFARARYPGIERKAEYYNQDKRPVMRNTLLPFSRPDIGDEEIAEVAAALRSGWITTGPRTRTFEKRFAAFTGAKAALALNSGTAALHLALAALGVGKGSAVIAPALTFCAGIQVIEHVGARPILVDVDPETLNIDPVQVERAAGWLRPGESLAAIMPVHLYGHSCDRGRLHQSARRYGCALIEDAAHALPGRYEGRMIGAADEDGVPVLTAFSFYATKNLTTGEGGMLTGPEALIEEARGLSLHGISEDAWRRDSWHYDVTHLGFKYNMSDLQAAIGMAQLGKLSALTARRREIAARYNKAFGQIGELQIPASGPEIEHAWHIYALRLNPEKLEIPRDEFIDELRRRNIAASVHFIPVHLLSWYRNRYGSVADDFPVAHREYQRLISLPLYSAMKDGDVEDVIEAVTGIAGEYRKARVFATTEA
jgi:dTDP-4-amino-4,6-dideoxygalactose transaminase